jgi:transposase-like protein
MDQVVRQRRDESAWREIVAQLDESGLTVREFCTRAGLNAASLYGWRTRLRRGASRGTPKADLEVSATEKAVSEFIDLGAIGGRARFEVRLELGAGVTLQLVRS